MGFRLRRRVKLFPGVSVNVSTSGVSTSIGRPGATITVGRRGVRGTVGLPGSGLSYTERLSESPTGRRTGGRVWMLAFGLVALALYAGFHTAT